MYWLRSLSGVLLSLLVVLVPVAKTYGQGIMLSSSGPVNRSMGGAAVAAPLDAIGALRWNPATISGLPCSELEFGVDLLWPITAVSSSVMGLGAGATDAEPGVAAVPTIGWVHKIDDSPFTIGLALIGVAGARTNYPASTTNPIFLPQSNAPGVPGGFGRVNSSAQYLDLAPTVSYAVSESLSVGLSPIIELAEVSIDPLVIASPDDADGSGVPRYPTAAGTHMSWGAGVQLGAYYIVNSDWRLGAALRTPTWMQSFQYLTVDEVGTPRRGRFRVDLPLVVSTGISYAGFQSTLIAFDVRYADYSQTAGFGPEGFHPDGSLRGLGWKSVISCALGVQRELSERLTARCGYTYLQNPTPQSMTGVNIAAPLHTEHQIGLGGTYALAPNVNLNVAYTYYLPHSITGPILTPNGPVPGTSVTNDLSAHVGSFGIQVMY